MIRARGFSKKFKTKKIFNNSKKTVIFSNNAKGIVKKNTKK